MDENCSLPATGSGAIATFSAPGPSRRLVAVLGFSFAIEGAMYSAVTPILPLLTRQHSLSDTVAGLLLSGYSGGLVIGSLLCVMLLSRVNPRDVAACGLVALGVSSVLFAWGDSGWALIVARVFGGTASGVLWTACVTWLISVSAKDRRGAALGSSMGFAVLGTVAGPTIGTVAVQVGVRLPYACVAAACGIASLFVLHLDRPPSMHLGAPPGQRVLPGHPRVQAFVAAGMVGLAGVVLGLANVAGPLVLTRAGASDVLAGSLFLGAAVICVMAGRPTGAAVDRFGAYRPLAGGLLLMAAVLPFLGSKAPVPVLAAVVVVVVVGDTLCYVPAATMLTRTGEDAGWSLRFAMALVAIVWGTGESVGAFLAGAGLDSAGAGWTTSAGSVFLLLGLSVLVLSERRQRPDGPNRRPRGRWFRGVPAP